MEILDYNVFMGILDIVLIVGTGAVVILGICVSIWKIIEETRKLKERRVNFDKAYNESLDIIIDSIVKDS